MNGRGRLAAEVARSRRACAAPQRRRRRVWWRPRGGAGAATCRPPPQPPRYRSGTVLMAYGRINSASGGQSTRAAGGHGGLQQPAPVPAVRGPCRTLWAPDPDRAPVDRRRRGREPAGPLTKQWSARRDRRVMARQMITWTQLITCGERQRRSAGGGELVPERWTVDGKRWVAQLWTVDDGLRSRTRWWAIQCYTTPVP